jgi:predicted metal-dependent phosphoesterase TrpH
VEGLPDFLAAGQGSSVETIPGVEFSTEFEEQELHILALFVHPEDYAPITRKMEDFRLRKERSNEELVAALRKLGMDIDYRQIREKAEGYVNRAVIGAELTRKGYTASVKEAFEKYLSPKRGYYVPPKRLDACETVAFIKSLGAVAVWAHPFLDLDEAGVRRFLPGAVEAGLDGMEVLYPKYSEQTMALAARIAEEFGILPSGGSDFHGENKPDIRLGTGRDNLSIPESFLENLRTRKK